MSTRINPDFYGAENTFVDVSTTYLKRSPYSISDLFTSGRYTGGAYDTTATPWGCGKSCFTSNFTFISAIGQNWLIDKSFNKKKNTPFYMYSNRGTILGGDTPWNLTGADASYSNYTKCMYKFRTSPKTTYNNGFKSTLTLDSGANIAVNNAEEVYPVTYADYQHLRAVITDVFYKPVGSNRTQKTTMDAIKNGSVSVDKIVSFNITQYSTNNISLALYMGTGGAEIDIPEIFRQCYYEGETKFVRPTRYARHFGYWGLDSGYYFPYTGSQNLHYATSFATPTSADIVAPYVACSGWGQLCLDNQVFDDVSYHWECGMYKVNTSDYWDISDKIENGDTYQQTLCASYAYMEFDDDGGNRNLAAYNAILHEVAFIGLPFVTSNDSTILAKPIGDDAVFLPVFDDHMITTGEFLSGSDSLNLPNSTWTDVFSEDMPEYDPEYDPEPPEPGEDDQGDLSNEYPHRYTNAGGLAQYVVDQGILLQLSAFLNGSYLPTSADLDADFKGTNPMDYIVSVQKYPFTLPNVGTSSDIYIGKNNTSLQGKKLFPDIGGLTPISINSASTFDFGSISIPYYFNDFRDYQSKIFLFMPFIGTDELDPRLYIGHALSLVYRVDYNTGSVIAEIKRDGLTMESKNGTISITVPFLAANMGLYQNQLAQLSYSKDMTKIKGVGTALSAGFTMAAGASGTLSSGQFPLAAASNLAQSGVQLAANATQLSQLDYQIEHTAPQLGTISTAGAATAFFMDDRARIIIARPKMLDGYNPTQYSHTIGNACCKTGTLSAFSGFTQAATAILDDVHTKSTRRQATEQERQLLRRALQNGIYL